MNSNITNIRKLLPMKDFSFLLRIKLNKVNFRLWSVFNFSTVTKFPFLVLFLLVPIILSGCKKLVEVDAPFTSISSDNLFRNDDSAIGALTGIYAKLSSASMRSGHLNGTSFLLGISSDELTLDNSVIEEMYLLYYQNDLRSFNLNYEDLWTKTYQIIYPINAAVEGIEESTSLSNQVKSQLLGEAHFLRALCYFSLVNLYGDVPKVLSTDYTQNSLLGRAPKEEIWELIITDLIAAKALMKEEYLNSSLKGQTSARIRPSKFAAIALLARCYLYRENWQKAESEATELISNPTYFSLPPLADAFLANSPEAIWQLQPVMSNSTEEGRFFIIPNTGPSPDWPVYLSQTLLDSFEPNDQRRTAWISQVNTNNVTYYFPYKYKKNAFDGPISEYAMVLRLGEQILIRAEARVKQGNLDGAKADLNLIRSRAGLSSTTATSEPEVLIAIMNERQVELFTEWGHRWLDLKRTQTIDAVMARVAPLKGGSWSSDRQWFPISQRELMANPNLIQNTGY